MYEGANTLKKMKGRCYMNNSVSKEIVEYGFDEIGKILEKIVELQKNAVYEEIKEERCDFGQLGSRISNADECNTRPVTVFTDDDTPWNCPINRDTDSCDAAHERTCILRIEKVDGGVATFRALKEDTGKLLQTDSFITIKLANISAIRCLKDTFVDLSIR